MEHLKSLKIILASQSPRRSELLTKLGLHFKTIPSDFHELLPHSEFATPADYVTETAKQKLLSVADKLSQDDNSLDYDLIISADTIVVVGNKILEKPKNKIDALEMLKLLRDAGEHYVITAVCLSQKKNHSDPSELVSFNESTRVKFGTGVSDEMLEWYVQTGDPMDKAGGYGYQSLAMVLVEELNGCYYNVVGLPVFRLVETINKMLLS